MHNYLYNTSCFICIQSCGALIILDEQVRMCTLLRQRLTDGYLSDLMLILSEDLEILSRDNLRDTAYIWHRQSPRRIKLPTNDTANAMLMLTFTDGCVITKCNFAYFSKRTSFIFFTIATAIELILRTKSNWPFQSGFINCRHNCSLLVCDACLVESSY